MPLANLYDDKWAAMRKGDYDPELIIPEPGTHLHFEPTFNGTFGLFM